MKTIKGLFFDLDGTLVDTLEANAQAYIEAVKAIDKEFTREMYAEIHGMRVDLFLPKYFPDITTEDIDKVRRAKAAIYPKYLHLARPHRQLIDFIKTLRTQHTTVLVTMAQRINTEAVLKAAKLVNMFDFIITGNDVEHAKPHPESYLKALEITGLLSDEALAFEDSESGIEAAKAAGIPVITITIPEEII
jgi:HAD superfamily hydrolase (TIGR01509 family)